jgi:hypothetical protein
VLLLSPIEMESPRQFTLVTLAQATSLAVGGFLVVKAMAAMAPVATMSDFELVVGPLAVALMWLGTRQA